MSIVGHGYGIDDGTIVAYGYGIRTTAPLVRVFGRRTECARPTLQSAEPTLVLVDPSTSVLVDIAPGPLLSPERRAVVDAHAKSAVIDPHPRRALVNAENPDDIVSPERPSP